MPEPLQWKGVTVPYAARWTGEINKEPAQCSYNPETGETLAFYGDGRENRESNGILWIREGLNRGGEPEFGHLSAYRQRSCMRRRKCQVCGNPIEGKVIRWLLDERQIITPRDPRLRGQDMTVTSSPPTCDECVEKSLKLCPAMSQNHVIARVLEYQIVGVSGLIVDYNPETQKYRQFSKALVLYDQTYTFAKGAVVAKQQVVQWTKFVME